MIRSYRYPLHPSRDQEAILLSWFRECCNLYNAALQQRREAWERQRKAVGYVAQSKDLTELRAFCPASRAVPCDILRSALRRLDKAFHAFFHRCRTQEKVGYPRFRATDRYDSFSFPCKVNTVEENRVNIPKLEAVRFNRYRPIVGEVKEITVGRRSGNRWYIMFACEVGEAPPKRPLSDACTTAVGVDLGIIHFIATSDGETVDAPKAFRKTAAMLAERQRRLSRKRRGSKSRERGKVLVARAYEKIANVRKDFSRKLAKSFATKYGLIAVERLNIISMMRGHLAKSINDAAWGTFLRCLKSKAEEAGSQVVAVDPRGTSQECSACGAVVPKGLSVRVHRCLGCGLVLDRDVNAARNILARALRVREQAQPPPGRGGDPQATCAA